MKTHCDFHDLHRRWLPVALIGCASGFTGNVHAASPDKNIAKYQQAFGSTSGYTLQADLFATDGIVSNFHRWRSTSASGHALEITDP